jgi:hypothetical protein
LRTVHFARGETDEGLDVAQPVVVEGELLVIRHPARREFPAVVEVQVREARRGRMKVPKGRRGTAWWTKCQTARAMGMLAGAWRKGVG